MPLARLSHLGDRLYLNSCLN